MRDSVIALYQKRIHFKFNMFKDVLPRLPSRLKSHFQIHDYDFLFGVDRVPRRGLHAISPPLSCLFSFHLQFESE